MAFNECKGYYTRSANDGFELRSWSESASVRPEVGPFRFPGFESMAARQNWNSFIQVPENIRTSTFSMAIATRIGLGILESVALSAFPAPRRLPIDC